MEVLAPSSSQDFIVGEPEHLSAERLPFRIWARLTGLSALTNDVIDGQNKEEHTKNISVWSGVSARLHQVAAEGIFGCMPHYTVMAFPGKAVSFRDTRQQAALWAPGPPSPEEGEAR